MNCRDGFSLGGPFGKALQTAFFIIFTVLTMGNIWAQDPGSARSAPVRESEEADQDLPAWINKETQVCVQRMLQNISPQGATCGAVMASPYSITVFTG